MKLYSIRDDWWICTGKIKGRTYFGAGINPTKALLEAFKS